MTEHSYRSKRPSIATLTKEEYRYIEPDSINEDLYCSICHDLLIRCRYFSECSRMTREVSLPSSLQRVEPSSRLQMLFSINRRSFWFNLLYENDEFLAQLTCFAF
ncbi:231_t:CDS:2, partial [Entrophospora sp. SA101]